MGDRGFDILKKEHLENRNKAYSVNVIRFLTSLNRVVGLGHFSLENYMLFRFEKIKPLFTIEAMRLFWENGQGSHPFFEKLMESLLKNEHLIPINDLHILLAAKKVIKNQEFLALADRVQARFASG